MKVNILLTVFIYLFTSFNSYSQLEIRSEATPSEKSNRFYKDIYRYTLERSYFNPGWTEQHYNLSGPAFNGRTVGGSYYPFKYQYIATADLNPRYFLSEGSKNAFAMTFQSRVKIRLIGNEFSYPVRTASFMPGATFYFKLKKEAAYIDYSRPAINLYDFDSVAIDDCYCGKKVKIKMGRNELLQVLKEREREVPFQYITVSYSHHSNGQDDAPINGFYYKQRLNNGIAYPLPNNRTQSSKKYIYNRSTGNFSTDYIELGYNWGKVRENSINDFQQNISSFPALIGEIISKHYLGLQPHFAFFGFWGDTEDSLKNRYSFLNLNYQYQYIQALDYRTTLGNNAYRFDRHERYRVIFNYSFALTSLKDLSYDGVTNPDNNFKKFIRYRPSFELIGVWPFAGKQRLQSRSTSFFASIGYKGMDDYNIYLEDSFWFAKVGFTSGINLTENFR